MTRHLAFTDPDDGSELIVASVEHAMLGPVAALRSKGIVHLPPPIIRQVVGALYAAAGSHVALVAVPDVAGLDEHTNDALHVRVGYVAAMRQVYFEMLSTKSWFEPEAAIEIGRSLVAFGQRAAQEPYPKQVQDLAEFLDETMGGDAEDLARALLLRFTMTDREPTP